MGQEFGQGTARLGPDLKSSLSSLKAGRVVHLPFGGESWLLAGASVLSHGLTWASSLCPHKCPKRQSQAEAVSFLDDSASEVT